MLTSPEVIRFGAFEFDLAQRQLRKQGRRLRLQRKPFELLAALLERPGEIVTREELRHRLWPSDTFVAFDDNLNTAVRKVREALGDSASVPRFVETVPRCGYRFVAPIDLLESAATRGTHLSPGVPATADTSSYKLRVASGRWIPATVVIGLLLVAVVAVGWPTRHRHEPSAFPSSPIRLRIPPPPGLVFGGNAYTPSATISPDGTRLVFLAASRVDRIQRIWFQSLDSVDATPATGTENGVCPFWSADGRRIGFTISDTLQSMEPGGSAPLPLFDATGFGSSWNARGDVLLMPASGHGPIVCLDSSGRRRPVTALDGGRGETAHVWPQFLPGGRAFLYLALTSDAEKRAVYVASLDGADRHMVLESQFTALYAPPGYLLFVRGDDLVAQRFDVETGRRTGDVQTVAATIEANSADGRVAASVSRNGVLAYSTSPHEPTRQLTWFARDGRRLAPVGPPGPIANMDLSPDGEWIAIEQVDRSVRPHAPDLWLLDVKRGIATRTTFSPANDEGPIWAPDSRRFLYARHPAIHFPADVFVRSVSGEGNGEAVIASSGSDHPMDWSRDGRFILYERLDSAGHSQCWVLVAADRTTYPLFQGPYPHTQARFSPDGRFVAYVSEESGRPEVYVQRFHAPGPKWQISQSGGARPRWRADGRELFFVSADEKMIAATMSADGRLPAGPPVVLFDLERLVGDPYTLTAYSVTADGQRFLVSTAVDEEAGGSPVFVVVNWPSTLPRPQ